MPVLRLEYGFRYLGHLAVLPDFAGSPLGGVFGQDTFSGLPKAFAMENGLDHPVWSQVIGGQGFIGLEFHCGSLVRESRNE
jgi:hypothetical protein